MLFTILSDNFRDNEGNHDTDLLCNYCDRSAEVYIILADQNRVCKTCLTKMINEIDKRIQRELEIGRRR